MTKTLFIGEQPFTTRQEALDFCNEAGLSPTLIHSSPLKLRSEWQLKIDQELASDKYWTAGPQDD